MNNVKLKIEILKKNVTIVDLAKKMGLGAQSLSNKINGRTEFKLSELVSLSELLELDVHDLNDIFGIGGSYEINNWFRRC